MQRYSGETLYSASDLVSFVECARLTTLDLENLDTPLPRTEDSEAALLVQGMGHAHEAVHLAAQKTAGLRVVEIRSDTGTFATKAAQTLDAMATGADVVYQATLQRGNLVGHADFLCKVPGRSRLGAWAYEVADTKLARTPKAKFLIQLAFYSDLLATAQQAAPLMTHLVLGNGNEAHYRVADYAHYYQTLLRRFQTFIKDQPETYPDPCDRCQICHWRGLCEAKRIEDDHLIQVADIRKSQIKRLKAAGILTLESLAHAPDELPIRGMAAQSFARLKQQARLQRQKRQTGKDQLELIDSAYAPERGFNRLPAPSEGDLFFDMEGDPFEDGGLEYLFGVSFLDNESLRFKAFWAHDRDEERRAFEAFVDFAVERLRHFPDAHIYHYAHYERTALQRLMSEHATREIEIDNLLRSGKLVDLYKVVRETMMVSEPSYSLKNIETFYLEKRKAEVKTAGASIVYYERWKEMGDAKLLEEIELYNAEDCRSTYELREWLLTLRPDAAATRSDPTVEDAGVNNRSDGVKLAEARVAKYRTLLWDPLPKERTKWGAEEHLNELVFYLVDFHRRAAKPAYWAIYARQEMSEQDLIEDAECISGMTLDADNPTYLDKRSNVYTYRFPEQEFKLRASSKCLRLDTLEAITDIVEIDEDHQRIVLKQSSRREALPNDLSIGPGWPISSDVLVDAITRFAGSLARSDGRFKALRALLLKSLPSIRGLAAGSAIINESKTALPQIIDAVARLENSYLFIQGPPGAGKTYTGANVIVALLRAGKRVGVSSNSHKAIHNLLHAIEREAKAQEITFSGCKKASSGNAESYFEGDSIENETTNEAAIDGDYQLLAGTAWLFCDEGLEETIDYLFVDEAGQVALANIVAMGVCAKNIVLLGDQMQLGQPIQGVHPGRSGESVLEYLLDGLATIPAEKGIFLATTWRMHPDVCRFISEAVYDGRLHPEKANAQQRLVISKGGHPFLRPTGVRHIPIAHEGCAQKSEEEAALVLALYQSLLKQQYVDRNGDEHDMGPDNILIVAPYNMQVNLLKLRLPEAARVGTVDKFQGQEAEAVIVSMTTSSEEDLPRYLEFLYSRNRLNVAISRARCLSLVIANPLLMATSCSTPEQMALVNTLCWLNSYSEEER